MGKKDLSQKSLEYYPDVFADCANALLYEGESVLKAETLLPAPTETVYPDTEGQLHSQLQDVSKFEMEGGSIRAQYTIENQTRAEKGMILRKAGYEGAIYRRQYMEGRTSTEGHRSADGSGSTSMEGHRSADSSGSTPMEGHLPTEKSMPTDKRAYPVISMVLYWGQPRWSSPCSLRCLTEGRLPEKATKYVDDIRLHVYEMAHLPEEVRRRFRSDMRIAVDYLSEGSSYVPTGQKILHVEALLRLLRELTSDEGYRKILEMTTKEEKEEGIAMLSLVSPVQYVNAA